MSVLSFISTLIFAISTPAVAAGPSLIIDAKTCAGDLSSTELENFARESGARQSLASEEGTVLATFVPGDAKMGKLIDVRGSNHSAIAAALIKRLKYSADSRQNPDLKKILEESLRLAQSLPAAFSISSWVMPDGDRTIRVSLDMAKQSVDKFPVVRLPNLEIKNGVSIKRVDIDIKPEQLHLLTGTTQGVLSGGRWLVGEPASHSLGLAIEGKDSHVLIDTFGSPASRFIGSEFPALKELLDLTERLARAVHPRAGAIPLRENDDIMAVSEGQGWHLPN